MTLIMDTTLRAFGQPKIGWSSRLHSQRLQDFYADLRSEGAGHKRQECRAGLSETCYPADGPGEEPGR